MFYIHTGSLALVLQSHIFYIFHDFPETIGSQHYWYKDIYLAAEHCIAPENHGIDSKWKRNVSALSRFSSLGLHSVTCFPTQNLDRIFYFSILK